ncbi:MAG: ATP-binding cassette domain-containing protein [Actinobacteria bacterium]|nr:ATP-binding cassette domain-containing protein [Actinomycetota bacterium]
MHGGGAWRTLHTLSRDSAQGQTKLPPGTTRRILQYARPFKGQIISFLVLVSISSVLGVVSPLLWGRIVDNGIVKGDKSVVITLSLVVAGIAVVSALIGLALRWFSSRIGEGLIYLLRTEVFSHVLRMPVAFFTRTQTGALISRLNTDVIGAQQAFTSTLSGVFSNVIQLVLVAIAMLAISWPITVASLLMLPIFLYPARRIGKQLQGLTRESMNLNASMSTVMTERFNVSGALLVKLFGRPQEEDESFSSKAGRVRDIGVRIAMANRIFFTALTLVAALATALIYGVGGVLVIDQTLTLGHLVALAALLSQLYGPLTSLANVRVDVMTALVSFDRVFEVLDLAPMIDEIPDAADLQVHSASIEFEHVDFHYPSAAEVSLASLEAIALPTPMQSVDVLRDVSFTIPAGSMAALVGPSGAGKTTITSLVPRLYDVTSGSVRIAGTDVRDVTLSSLRERIGVVTQDAHMFHDTIRANLLYAKPSASDAELDTAVRLAQIFDLVQSLPEGLDTVVGDRGYRLSGGEKQRLAIARLLLKAPEIVVLDEATAHLDSESELAVQQALAVALKGRTSLVIAHRLSTVRDADMILVVDDGRIVQTGTHDELIATGGLYSDLYRTQFLGQPS